MVKVCVTTNKEVTSEYIEFKCPGCLKANIVRSRIAKRKAAPYNCTECGFLGP
ncbi:MAG TPA: zinc finger domain-containing protein [archaeon]|nr:zinc finger domain-containing protein [archaeon]